MLHLEKSFQRYLILERDTQEEGGRELKAVKKMLDWYIYIHTALTANADTSLFFFFFSIFTASPPYCIGELLLRGFFPKTSNSKEN